VNVQLQELRQDPKTPLREQAIVVERLAQDAYSDLPIEGRRSLAIETSLNLITNIGNIGKYFHLVR